MTFLWGAAEDDELGNAALSSSRRLPDRIPRRLRNLVIASAVGALVAVGAAKVAFPPDRSEAGSWNHGGVDAGSTLSYGSPTPMPSGVGTTPGVVAPVAPGGARRQYAVGVHDLRGLPPDVMPGQKIDLWVAWDEFVSEGPQIQRLVKDVTLVRLIEPVTPDGPVVALLELPARWVADVMYGGRFGSFSVTLPSSSS